MRQRTTVVGVFSDHEQAERAIDELRRSGFRDDQIGVAGRRTEVAVAEKTTEGEDTHAGTGAIAGVVAGAGLGALAGLGILAGVIPVIGPAIAGGTLGVILSNAAGGAAVAGLAGALIGAGIPEKEAEYYNREFEAGRMIVTVTADGRATRRPPSSAAMAPMICTPPARRRPQQPRPGRPPRPGPRRSPVPR